MKNYLSRILSAIILSGPIAAFTLAVLDSVVIHYYIFGENYSLIEIDVIFFHTLIYSGFFYLFYIIFGLPTTLLTDLIVRFLPTKRIVVVYIFSFITYTVAGTLLWFRFKNADLSFLWYIFIPVYTYLITLSVIRSRQKWL